MRWVDNGNYIELVDLPPWRDHGKVVAANWSITLEPRPYYCDRGRWLAKCHAPLDHQEGWPRYYFDLNAAKSEIEEWCQGRGELGMPIAKRDHQIKKATK